MSKRVSFELDRDRTSAPDGAVAEHLVNRVQRTIDALHRAGAITDDMATAAGLFRDNWERGRLMADSQARDINRVDALGDSDKASACWERHRRCMAALDPVKRKILSQVVLHDNTPASLDEQLPLSKLERALHELVGYCARGHLDILA